MKIEEIYFVLYNMPYITPYYSKILKGVEKEIKAAGIPFRYESLEGSAFATKKRNIGIIVTGRFTSQDLESIKSLRLPFIAVGDAVQKELIEQGVDMVTNDNFQGAYLATRYLLESGHRKIGIVAEDWKKYGFVKLQIEGYEKAHRDSGLKWDNKFKMISGTSGVEKLLKNVDLFTALVVCGDIPGIDILRMFRKNSLRIPEDVSFIGIGDMSSLKAFEPDLTLVDLVAEKQGRMAVRELLKNSRRPGHQPRRIVLPMKLTVGRTTRRMEQ
jgi:DNA-binding LacI/PurR family transcriptional regulator